MKKGFTLSEVLITLVIIGIIAAVTLPVLFANYQEQAVKSSLKKNYSVLKQALDKYQAEHSERLYAGQDENYHLIKNYLTPYLNVLYDCGLGHDDYKKACIANSDSTETSSKNYKTYNGKSTINLNNFDDGQFVLNDGSLVLIEDYTGNIYISVDVNGFGRKPNRLGRDLFMFQLTDKGELLPMGMKGTTYYDKNNAYCSNTSSSNMNGAGCTFKMLTD